MWLHFSSFGKLSFFCENSTLRLMFLQWPKDSFSQKRITGKQETQNIDRIWTDCFNSHFTRSKWPTLENYENLRKFVCLASLGLCNVDHGDQKLHDNQPTKPLCHNSIQLIGFPNVRLNKQPARSRPISSKYSRISFMNCCTMVYTQALKCSTT